MWRVVCRCGCRWWYAKRKPGRKPRYFDHECRLRVKRWRNRAAYAERVAKAAARRIAEALRHELDDPPASSSSTGITGRR
jgi:hypothetical protein